MHLRLFPKRRIRYSLRFILRHLKEANGYGQEYMGLKINRDKADFIGISS